MAVVLPFVLLFKGNEWAWRKQKWQSVAHFQATQKKWSKWALIVVVSFPFLIALFLPIVITALKAPGYYDMGLEKLLSDERVIAALGTPIEPGWWVEGSATLGSAGISVPLKGSKASGRGCFFARKQSGEWVINGLMFSVDEMQEPVILRPFDARGPHGQALGRTFCKYSVSRR